MPGDVVVVEPGDQLVADGEVVSSRGLTLDEALLTGEADGIRKGLGDRALSGSFCLSGSGSYRVDAVREESYAGKLAGEARAFRHPPSPLQDEVNRVIIVCTYVMIPLAVILLLTFQLRSVDLVEAAQTATAGLVTLIPEGLVLLMSVTFAVAAVRLAGRDTLVQQMSATESLAAVDTICVDKTGTLTDGNLKLLGVEIAESVEPEVAQKALGRFASSAGERNRTLEAIAANFPVQAGRVSGEVPFSSVWKWSGLRFGATSYVLGAPDILEQAGALALTPGLKHKLDQETEAGRRVVAFGESAGALPDDPAEGAAAAAEAGGAGRPRGDPAPRRRRDDRLDPRGRRRPEADLGRRAGDRDRGRLLGRGPARGRRRRRPRPARPIPRRWPRSPSATRSSAGSRPSRSGNWSRPCANRGASRR